MKAFPIQKEYDDSNSQHMKCLIPEKIEPMIFRSAFLDQIFKIVNKPMKKCKAYKSGHRLIRKVRQKDDNRKEKKDKRVN